MNSIIELELLSNRELPVAVLCDYSKTALKLYMTDEDIAQKVRVVYHPTYDGIYPTSEVNIPELSSDSNKMHILFVGNIRPYKNIEMILKIAEDYKEKDVEFTIAGKPISEEYARVGGHFCVGDGFDSNVNCFFSCNNEIIIGEDCLLILCVDCLIVGVCALLVEFIVLFDRNEISEFARKVKNKIA